MVIMISVKIKGDKELIAKLKKIQANTPYVSSMMLNDIARSIQRSAKLRAPRFTGSLAQSITVRPLSNWHVQCAATELYAGYQEFGYTPHWVKVWGRPALEAWTLAKLGFIPRDIYVSKFTPFFEPAVKAVVPKVPAIIKKYSEAWIK
jgi:hypothetical protein